MLFKEKPWTVLENNPALIKTDCKGFYCLYAFDPYLEKLFHGRISLWVKNNPNIEYRVLQGKEITTSWIEDNIINPGLFAGEFCYFVLNSEEILSDTLDLIYSESSSFKNGYLIFSSLKKLNFFKKLSDIGAQFYSVDSIPFWEFDKLLDFLAKEIKVKTNPATKKYILANTENTVGSFINTLKSIKLFYGDQTPSLAQLSDLIPANKLDFFHMASLFSKGQKKEFLAKILEMDGYNINWHQFISFMIGHIIKLLDPSELSSKKSSYEKETIIQSKTWSKGDLVQELKFFGNLQSEIKTRKDVRESLRLHLLETI